MHNSLRFKSYPFTYILWFPVVTFDKSTWYCLQFIISKIKAATDLQISGSILLKEQNFWFWHQESSCLTCQGALKIVEPDIVELASTVETLACVQHRSIFRSALQQRVLHANFHWSVLPPILIPSPQNIGLLGLRATSRTWNRLNSMHKVLYRVTEEHHIETLFLFGKKKLNRNS